MIDAVVLFRQGINAIRHHLKSMSGQELIVTVAAYDVSVANLYTYGAAVHELVERFRRRAIRSETSWGEGGVRVGIYT